MKSELKEISPTQKEIHLEIDAAAIKESYGKVSQKYANRASVPGFRKGYAPLDVVRLRFKEEIKSEVLQDVVPSAVTAAIQEHKLQPLTEPHLHLVDQESIKVNGTVPLSLHVHVEVMPELPKPKYKGIEITRRVKPVDDSEVEDLIAERLQKEAALIPVEGRRSKIGDTVIADLEGRFADSPDGDPIKAEDIEVELGGEHIEKSFTENLVGVKQDDEKEFTVEYPKEFSSEALAGKTVHYKAKIKSVGRTEVPKLDDDWAKSLDEGYKSLADLRKRLKADLEKVAKADADARVSNNAIAKLIEDNAFEVPGVVIENQARNLLNNFAQDMQQRGIDLKQVESQFIEMAYANMRQQAARDVQGSMLLEKVAELEKVEVSDAEVDEEIGKMAAYYSASPNEIRESLEKQGGGIDNIRNNLRTRKAIEAVVAKAKVVDGEWVDASAAQQQEAEKPKKAAKKKAPAKKKAVKD
jgi:trigger factor